MFSYSFDSNVRDKLSCAGEAPLKRLSVPEKTDPGAPLWRFRGRPDGGGRPHGRGRAASTEQGLLQQIEGSGEEKRGMEIGGRAFPRIRRMGGGGGLVVQDRRRKRRGGILEKFLRPQGIAPVGPAAEGPGGGLPVRFRLPGTAFLFGIVTTAGRRGLMTVSTAGCGLPGASRIPAGSFHAGVRHPRAAVRHRIRHAGEKDRGDEDRQQRSMDFRIVPVHPPPLTFGVSYMPQCRGGCQ